MEKVGNPPRSGEKPDSNVAHSDSDQSSSPSEIFANVVNVVKEQVFPEENSKTPIGRTLESGREKLNSNLEKLQKSVPEIVETIDPSAHSHVFRTRFMDWSNRINEAYPYPSMLMRTHGTAITLTTTAVVLYGSRRLGRKFATFTGVATLGVGFAAMKLINFRFY